MLNLLALGAIIWIALVLFAIALCRASARADLAGQRELGAPPEVAPAARMSPAVPRPLADPLGIGWRGPASGRAGGARTLTR